ncbi:VCBS repeat-containing protein [Salegentibacter sp. JZCK2]|uniref:VCBS repeat-containing protein n=1 Tax=Salegentibacter tibetensis TaxID=2873600 RepID=UPI001CD03722|nr:VCBS repeat-containing protein [Salegentibacter tibetensis]MBZ9728266.1 VCBS repeat-containing protein [Salegentibacter tibetensis]
MKAQISGLLAILFLCIACKNSSESNESQDYLLNKLPPEITNINFTNKITEDPEHSIINYIYYYNGGGVAAGDINNDGLPDLYFVSNMGENKLFLNKGNLKFEDVTEKANVGGKSSWNTGVTMVDINNDGLLDIYVSAVSGLLDFEGHNELFINNGDGTFSEKSAEYGLDFKGYSTQAYFFDYDNDGDLDVYIVNHAIHTTLSHGSADVRNKRVPSVGDVLLENNNGKFTDVSEKAGIYGGINGYGLSASLADFNNDGWVDIYVSNDFHEDDYYYINNQDGTFTETLDSAFSTISRFSMGSDAADITGNGYQDLITLDMLPKDEKVIKESEGDDAMYNMQKRLSKLGYKDQYARNMLQINNEGSNFQEMALYNEIAATDWSWAPLLADFNNDGHQDLFISNGILRRPNDLDFKNFVATAFKNRSPNEGMKWLYNSKDEMPEGKVSNEIFKGNSLKFERKTGEWIEDKASFSNGAIYVDLDLDGDLDLVINNLNEEAGIYENTTNASGDYLSLQFEYPGNNYGIGTKAILFSEGQQQLKQLFNSRGFLSSVESKLHFGLGKEEKIDSVHIIWPNNTYQKIQPQKNQNLKLVYSENAANYNYEEADNREEYFKYTNTLEYAHKEDEYDDFHQEKLIPYSVSMQGPAVATGDIDNNGFDDIFIGGASGYPSKLFLNDGKTLTEVNIEGFARHKEFEDNAAVFFDADNDGDLDLYVASGINSNRMQFFENDRLYINNNGEFDDSPGSMPKNYLNSSTAISLDYNKDGFDDLFIGNLSDPGNFGKQVESYLLKNDQKGNFTKDPNFSLSSMVTSAISEDINNDGSPDLLVATEWDSPKIYLNEQGDFKAIKLPEGLLGLWQSIAFYDIDGDGQKDILLGNWGLNTRFEAKKDAPLRMYYADFNKDGKFETVIAYNKNGKYYPIHSRNELASQMNFISKKFPTHQEFSLKTMEDIFTPEVLSSAKMYEINTLASGYLKNNNGEFSEFIEFPMAFQTAPINSFQVLNIDGEEQLLVSGNSYKVNTYHGGYSSLKGLLVKTISDYKKVLDVGIKPFDQQIKNTVSVPMRDKNLLIVVPNNDSISTYSYDK